MITVNGVCNSLVILVKKWDFSSWVLRCISVTLLLLRQARVMPISISANINVSTAPPHLSAWLILRLLALACSRFILWSVSSRTPDCVDNSLDCSESVNAV